MGVGRKPSGKTFRFAATWRPGPPPRFIWLEATPVERAKR